jgi:hypothetical protein
MEWGKQAQAIETDNNETKESGTSFVINEVLQLNRFDCFTVLLDDRIFSFNTAYNRISSDFLY